MPYKFKIDERVKILKSGTIGRVAGYDRGRGMAPYWVSGQTWFASDLEAAPLFPRTAKKARKKRGAK